MALPNTKLLADAQSVIIFANAVSQCAAQMINAADPTTPEYAMIKDYFLDNLPMLNDVLTRLEHDLA